MTDSPLLLVSTSTATTFNFRNDDLGWACCTVNDSTGELAITSDWGNYAHRWHIAHLGHNQDGILITLTEFISGGSIDYLADKLTSREERDRFDAEGTIAAFREIVREKRRESKSLYSGLSRPSWRGPRDGELDKDTARRLWDAIESLCIDCENTRNGGDWFVERYFSSRDMEGASLVCEEPWNLIRHKPSGEYLALTKVVLPALIGACREAMFRRTAPGLAEILDRPIPGART